MTNEITMWLMGGLAVWCSAGTIVVFSMVQRLAKVEGILALVGRNAAKALHSPTDHLDMDWLLEKFIDPNYKLTVLERKMLQNKCEQTLSSPTAAKDEKFFAGIIHAMCVHRLEITNGNNHFAT